MLMCLQIRHNCLMHMCLLQGIPTSASARTQCGMSITIFTSGRSGHFLTNAKLFHGHEMLHGDVEGD
jgi:hypothetical protein